MTSDEPIELKFPVIVSYEQKQLSSTFCPIKVFCQGEKRSGVAKSVECLGEDFQLSVVDRKHLTEETDVELFSKFCFADFRTYRKIRYLKKTPILNSINEITRLWIKISKNPNISLFISYREKRQSSSVCRLSDITNIEQKLAKTHFYFVISFPIDTLPQN